MQHQAFRLGVQQVQDVVRRLCLAQRVFHIFRQRAGEQLQDLQMFVGLGGNHHRQIGCVFSVPQHAVGEMHQPHAGVENRGTRFGRAVRNGNALAEIGTGLRFARFKTV